jgi:hypothetical protein
LISSRSRFGSLDKAGPRDCAGEGREAGVRRRVSLRRPQRLDLPPALRRLAQPVEEAFGRSPRSACATLTPRREQRYARPLGTTPAPAPDAPAAGPRRRPLLAWAAAVPGALQPRAAAAVAASGGPRANALGPHLPRADPERRRHVQERRGLRGEVAARQGAGGWLAGSTTARPRAGNAGTPFVPYPRSGAASNWLGLPNPGHRPNPCTKL